MDVYDQRRRNQRRQDLRARDERERRARDADFVARVGAEKVVVQPDPLQKRVNDLIARDLVSVAWSICIGENADPERYGLYQAVSVDEWETVAHYMDATPGRYRYEGMGMAFTPSRLISITFAAISTGYMAGFASAIDPKWPNFDFEWAGSTKVTERTCLLIAHCYRRKLIERARQRYRDGFYADPFAAEPIRRPEERL